MDSMPRIAAVADVHCHEHMRGQLAESLRDVNDRADILIIAGDLTSSGQLSEARELLKELRHVTIPIIAVLGNHDFEHDQQDQIHDFLKTSGILILDGEGSNWMYGERESVSLEQRGSLAGSGAFC